MNTFTQYEVFAGCTRSILSTIEEANKIFNAAVAKFKADGFEALIPDFKFDTQVCGFASKQGYSDAHPYEIIRVVSGKTIEVRAMDAELINGDDLKFHVGGFSAHCSNQYCQEYSFTSNEAYPIERIRLNKHGRWVNHGNMFNLDTKPYKFYDYNF